MTPAERRRLASEGKFDAPTAGCCDGYVQANLVALPEAYAADFEKICRANPKACPLLETVGPGTSKTAALAPGADLADTVPRYRACIITGRYPEVHGEPVHIGYPGMIAIRDIAHPEYGDPVTILKDEIPVFRACGVTPQNGLLKARLPFAVTHAPGYIFVSDLKNEAYAVQGGN